MDRIEPIRRDDRVQPVLPLVRKERSRREDEDDARRDREGDLEDRNHPDPAPDDDDGRPHVDIRA